MKKIFQTIVTILMLMIFFHACGGGAPASPWQGTKQWGTVGEDYAFGVAVDGSGNIYLAGSTSGDLDGNTDVGSYDAFLSKCDFSGATQWTRLTRLLGTSVNAKARGVNVDGSGNIYVTGITSGDLDGNTNAGPYDAFLVKCDSSGTKQWTRLLGAREMMRLAVLPWTAAGTSTLSVKRKATWTGTRMQVQVPMTSF